MRELSVVITVINEGDNIHPLVDEIRKALSGMDYEVVFVDDGSTDATRKRVKEIIDDRITLVELKKLWTKYINDGGHRPYNREIYCPA
ncbi:MAG TPA: glycosyltransferase [Chitinophagaceae bacterium]|jgi:glycosyltransferase involved in cell wall biosynthesis